MIQSDFLGIQDLEIFSERSNADLFQVLEDFLSSNSEVCHQALEQLRQMDAHRRSPLVAAFLVYQITVPDLGLRTKIVLSICEIIASRDHRERSPIKVREYLFQTLRGMGLETVLSLLELASEEEALLVPVCRLLNQCSASGAILVKILNSSDYPIPIRMASCKAIGEIGFLEAEQTIEALERRLTERTRGQLSMAFAARSLEEAKELIPILRDTLQALREASI